MKIRKIFVFFAEDICGFFPGRFHFNTEIMKETEKLKMSKFSLTRFCYLELTE